MARGDLTGQQWERLKPLLTPIPAMGRTPRDRRQVFNGIWWRARTGSPWRDLPDRYGPWEPAYALFRRWQPDGTWAKILTALHVTADAEGASSGRCPSTPRSAGPTNTPPEPVKRGDPSRTAGWSVRAPPWQGHEPHAVPRPGRGRSRPGPRRHPLRERPHRRARRRGHRRLPPLPAPPVRRCPAHRGPLHGDRGRDRPAGRQVDEREPFNPVAPAFANALRDATGLRFTELS